jgi:hypothetical protein
MCTHQWRIKVVMYSFYEKLNKEAKREYFLMTTGNKEFT